MSDDCNCAAPHCPSCGVYRPVYPAGPTAEHLRVTPSEEPPKITNMPEGVQIFHADKGYAMCRAGVRLTVRPPTETSPATIDFGAGPVPLDAPRARYIAEALLGQTITLDGFTSERDALVAKVQQLQDLLDAAERQNRNITQALDALCEQLNLENDAKDAASVGVVVPDAQVIRDEFFLDTYNDKVRHLLRGCTVTWP